MSVTVKNESTGKVSLPRPFVTTLAAGATKTVTGIGLDGIDPGPRAKLQSLANAGKISITETDETLARGTPNDANVADIRQIVSVGQGTAANGSVETVALVDRPCYLEGVTCFFDSVPAATETITTDLVRNGTSVLTAAFVVDDTSTLPSEAATKLPGAVDQTDGVTSTADTDRFSAATYTFTAADVGNILLINSGGTNDGAYIITNFVDANNVDCTDLEGADPGWTTETGIEFDVLLAFQPGDILSLTSTVANTTNLNYWGINAVLVPR